MAKQGAALLLGAALVFNAGDFSDYREISVYAAETDGASAAAVTASDTEWTSGSYEVTGDVTLGSRVNVSGDVTLILGDGCLLTASKGIGVSAGNSLTITGNGELKATGERFNAGIGGSYPFPDPDSSNGISGAVTIESGTVTAAGGQYAAGIGGGCANNTSTDGGIGSNITINGGTVTAIGGQYAAGIGSGCYKVTPSYIEGGNYNNGENITITGGTVVAVGGDQGAGIGGGYSGFDFDHGCLGGSYSNITISDNCDVTAVSGKGGGAGIGGGYGGDAYGIVISGGIIKATSGGDGAGIGSGSNGDNADITISGGTVEAIGSSGGGAGIGGGIGSGCSVTISGGTVKATGSSVGGAGIGGGRMCKGSIIITITDGNITAVGGSGTYEAESSGYISRVGAGAGIGGGGMMTDSQYEHTVAVEISGGVVNAAGGSSYGWKDPDTLTGDCAAPGIGFGGAVTENGSVTFSTGDNGNALIIAAGGTNDTGKVPDITNGDNTSGWSGMIFQGNDGEVYGNNYTISEEVTIPSGATLTVDSGKTLTIAQGGSITGEGKINGGGTFLTENLTQDMISVPSNLVYNGSDRTNYIKDNTMLTLPTYCGKEFQVTGWTLSVTTTDNFNYTVTYTHKNGETVTTTVTLLKSGATLTATSNKTEYAYSDTITINATVKPSGTAANAPVKATSRLRGEPTAGQMVLFYNGVQVSAAADETDGSYTMTVNAADLVKEGAGYDGTTTLTVKYVGTEVMADESAEVEITLKPAVLAITGATLAEKTFDGKTTATVSGATLSGFVGSDSLTYGTDYTATAAFADANAGTNKIATVTVTLADTVTNYTLAESTYSLENQSINKANVTLTFGDQTITYGDTPAPAAAVPDAVEITYSYAADGGSVSGLPKNVGTYTVTATVTNTDNYNGTTATSTLTIDKADYPANKPADTMNVLNSCEKVSSAELPADWMWSDADKDKSLEVGTPLTATANYTAADKDNFNNVTVTIVITRSNCAHTNTVILDAVAATCTKAGYTGDTYCGDCGVKLSTGTATALAAHTEKSEITKPATYTEEGTKTITCSVCNALIREETIPKLTRPSEPDTPDGPGENSGTTEKPYIKGDDDKEGWEVIRDEINNTDNGSEITVEMNGTTEVPGDILNSIKGEDITIVFDMDNGVSWSVNGKDVTEAVGSIDFGVTVGASDIPVDVINNVTGENYSMQLSLNYNGKFGFKAVLSVDLGTRSAGCYASLYYYNEQSSEPEFVSENKITENGIANLGFTHASDYIVVVNEKSRFDKDDTSDSSGSSDTSGSSTDSGDSSGSSTTSDSNDSSPAEDNPHTGTNTPYIAVLIAALGVIGLLVTMRKKKDKQR